MKVLCATLRRSLFNNLSENPDLEVIGPCKYNQAVVQMASNNSVDVVLLGLDAEGDEEIHALINLIYDLRALNLRVVVLADDFKKDDEFIRTLVGLGIYDLLFYPYTINDVVQKIMHPTPSSEIFAFKVKPIPPKNVLVQDKSSDSEVNINKKKKRSGKLKDSIKAGTDRIGSGIKNAVDVEKLVGVFKTGLFKKRSSEIIDYDDIIVTIWSPKGFLKAETALNLSVTAKMLGWDVALVNYDFVAPELDYWFEIRQTSLKDCSENDAGIMTFGEGVKPELAASLLRDIKWGIKYLPAGNKLGNIGTPDYSERNELFRDVLELVGKRVANNKKITVVCTNSDIEYPTTFAALSAAEIVIIPTSGFSKEYELIEHQISEINRCGIKTAFKELLFSAGDVQIRRSLFNGSAIVDLDPLGYIESSFKNEPYCIYKGKESWQKAFNNLII